MTITKAKPTRIGSKRSSHASAIIPSFGFASQLVPSRSGPRETLDIPMPVLAEGRDQKPPGPRQNCLGLSSLTSAPGPEEDQRCTGALGTMDNRTQHSSLIPSQNKKIRIVEVAMNLSGRCHRTCLGALSNHGGWSQVDRTPFLGPLGGLSQRSVQHGTCVVSFMRLARFSHL